MRQKRARWFVLAAIPLLISAGWIAARWGLADLYYQPAVSQFKTLRDTKIALSGAERQAAETSLRRALALDPNNPFIHEYLASALQMRAGAARRAALQQAIAHYRRAIAERPVWPYAWLGLATAKYEAGQIDAEYDAALRQAARLGPAEQVVQRYIIELGLDRWAEASEEDRLFTLSIIARAMAHLDSGHVRQTLQIIETHGLLPIICRLHHDKDNVNRYCEARIPGWGE